MSRQDHPELQRPLPTPGESVDRRSGPRAGRPEVRLHRDPNGTERAEVTEYSRRTPWTEVRSELEGRRGRSRPVG